MKRPNCFFLFTFLLSACMPISPPAKAIQATAFTSTIASVTPTSYITDISQTHTPPPTEWIRFHPTKQILVIYGGVARTQYSALFINRGYFDFSPILVLYTDGQLILSGRYTKQITQEETDEVLAKLEQLGFFQIQATYAADEQNSIYIFPTEPVPPHFVNLGVVIVNGQASQKVTFRRQWEEYLIQSMKDTITYLESFSYESTTLYQPDRLLVGFITEKEIPIAENATVIPWPNDITPPSESSYDGVLYLEGTEALKLYNIVEENSEAYFTFDGIRFQVYLRPIYPHECPVYHYYPDLKQPSFICDDW